MTDKDDRSEFGANSKAEFAIEVRNLKRRIAELEGELQAARRASVVQMPNDVAALVASAQALVLDPTSHVKKLKLEVHAWGPLAAAPVQLPEPQAEIEVRSMKTYLDLSVHEWSDTLPDGTYKVYTEHQVRLLLAAQEQSHGKQT